MKRFIIVIVAAYLFIVTGLVIRDVYHEGLKPPASASMNKENDFASYLQRDKIQRPVARESRLSARLAIWNDTFIRQGNKYWTRMPATAISSRLFAASLFPISLNIDLLYSSGQLAYQKTMGDASLTYPYWERVRKNILGMLATPASLLSPDLVTNHFIPVGTEQAAICPYGKLYSAHAIELYPQTVEEVQEIIVKARALNKKVSIAGKLFSQGKQALPSDCQHIVLHLNALNKIAIDPVQKIAYCGPGATWQELQAAANDHKLAVRVMQASNLFSIGGSLSINCHGWDHKTGAVCQTVRSLKLVDSNGDLLTLAPGDELFHLALGGIGGFGVIVEAELSLADNSLLECTGVEIDPQNYLDYFRNKIEQDPRIALHYYRLSLEPGKLFQTGIAANYVEAGPAEKSVLLDESEKGRVIDRIKLQTLRRLKELHQLAWNKEKKSALQTVKAARNECMQPPMKAILSESHIDAEWLQEYFVKPEHLHAFLEKLAAILNKHKVVVLNASIRYVAANSSKSFNYAPDGERFAIVLFYNQSLQPKKIADTKEWVKEAVDALHEFGGSYYLAYQAIPTVEQFRKSYPNWQEIKELKQKWDPENLFDNGFFSDYLSHSQEVLQKPVAYRALFATENGMRSEIGDFIANIFMQLDQEKLFVLMDQILLDSTIKDEEVYPILLSRIDEAQSGKLSQLKAAFTSLKRLQNDLADQVKSLLGQQPLQGYLEIGYPGRMIRPLQNSLNLTGKMIVVNTDQSLMDYLESGFPSPVDQFIPLNDYEPISSQSVPSDSVDLVSIFIGLHHIPEEKLVPFIRSIQRVLRPGGHLILMDHDANTEKMAQFLSLIHALFNAGTAVSIDEEAMEYRNFRPLDYWLGLLEKQGLVWDGQKPLIRKGDPSLNSVVILNKPDNPSLSAFLKKNEIVRNGIQTYLTGPEWQNVRAAQNYAAFIEHTPFYSFPYFEEIGNFWHVYGESWKAARSHYSLWDTLTSEYTLMNTFIGVMMTAEYGIKGIISLPFAWLYTQESIQEPLTTHVLITAAFPPENSESRIVESYDGTFHLEIPRYKKGSGVLQELALAGANFVSIAGQNLIQVDLLLEPETPLPRIPGGKFLYQVPILQTPQKVLAAYEMPVQILAENIRQLSRRGMQIDYIHDY